MTRSCDPNIASDGIKMPLGLKPQEPEVRTRKTPFSSR
jgi:hypothetical protein